MNILWAVNLIPAELSEKLHIQSEVLGGWVESMTGQLRGYEDIHLAIACKAGVNQVFDEEIA